MMNHKGTQTGTRNGQPGEGTKGYTRKRLWIIGFLLLVVVAAFVLAGWIRRPASADTDKVANTNGTVMPKSLSQNEL